jgi:HK97 family phage prohead protease
MTLENTSSFVRKATLSDVDGGLIFVLSDETPDHYNDIIRVKGWRLPKGQIICLFNHDKSFIIGYWLRAYIEGDKLKGQLHLAPQGSSPRLDELRALVKCGALRCCSVGFKPIRSRPREGGGTEFLEQELLECSLVALGCNPSALIEAKSMGVSVKTIRKIVKEQNKNASLAERIQDARFAVKLHNEERNKPKLTKIYTAREREEIQLRAEQHLLRAGYKLPPKKKTISAYVERESSDQRIAHAKDSLAKAKEMIEKWNREKALERAKAESKARVEKRQREKEEVAARKEARDRRDYKRFEWKDDEHFVTWQGQKIPKSAWEKD